jgi:ubiquinone/menaquinone biosynthesis C-methylase UbiE
MDWAAGEYELIATQLLPAARTVIEHAVPEADEHVVDVGCGTGNAALIAGERGARVTGVDPARRLLDVAAAQAKARGLDAKFLEGEAAALPLPDASADVLVSVFGVIFAPDASAAAGEMARVAKADGRLVLSAWRPGGPLAEVMRVRGEALSSAAGTAAAAPAGSSAGAGSAPFAWHEPRALSGLLEPHGFSVELHHQRLAFIAASPSEFVDTELRVHPAWIAARAVLEPRGEMEAVRERALRIFEDANEDPSAFRVTSDYVVAVARRG